MNQQELDKLIEKYYQGLTDEEEEKRLFDKISSGKLPAEYSEDLAILMGLAGGKDDIPEPDSGFEARIMEAIDRDDSGARVISLKRRIYSAVSVAATLLIVISSYLLVRNNGQPADTFDDPVLAYNATIEVLSRVGETLNTGSDVISELSVISTAEDNLNRLSEPARIISKEMESLKYIEKSMDILDMGSGRKDN
jgi:hypothetical protein